MGRVTEFLITSGRRKPASPPLSIATRGVQQVQFPITRYLLLQFREMSPFPLAGGGAVVMRRNARVVGRHFAVGGCSFFSSAVATTRETGPPYSSASSPSTSSSTTQPDDLWPPSNKFSPIYVAATRQHVGKTTTSLALMSGLQKRLAGRVGFVKPVGQQSLNVFDELTGQHVQVDKDAALIKQHFQLDNVSYRHASPVLIPPGYTRDYLDGRITQRSQTALIKEAFDAIQKCSDIVLCEGTGHVAVGSIVDASNADIAALVGAKVVIVANGGLGNSFDELELNRNLLQSIGVDIAGVIINKVRPDKYDQTKHYLSKALEQKWGPSIPLLGCIPDRPFLGCPSIADIERLFGASLVSGAEHRLRHYRVEDLTLVATSLEVFLKRLRLNRQAGERKLFVCHSSRNDILLGYLMESIQRSNPRAQHKHSFTTSLVLEDDDAHNNWDTAMIVTGCEEHPISTQVLEIVTNLPDSAPPVLMTNKPTDSVMQGLYRFTPKLNNEDGNRVDKAVQHYEPYIDFDLLLDRVKISDDENTAAISSTLTP